MIKYGIENYTFSVIEVCDQDIIEERELFWIRYFNSSNSKFGYNLRTDECGAMIVHDLTRKKISERLKLEWSSGARVGHSDKLKASWENRDREFQSKLMSKNLTKYLYRVYRDEYSEDVLYKRLKELGLHGCIAKFAKYKTDIVDFKGLKIERLKIETYGKNSDN